MAQKVSFQTILQALTDESANFPSRYLEHFSDLTPANLAALMVVWPRVLLRRKRILLRNLVERFKEDTLVSYDVLASALLDDGDAQVRTLALELLEESEDAHLIPRLVEIVADDPAVAPRAAAASLLGQFVRLAELERLSQSTQNQIEESLIQAAQEDAPEALRYAALEALGYSSRPEVEKLIETNFSRHDPLAVAAALWAMGRSANPRWRDHVVGALGSDDPKLRLAAVVAAGELGLSAARSVLLGMFDEEDDDDVLQAMIWSLSQIGGEDVRTYLEALLDQTDDEDVIEYIEDALANLSFTEDAERFDLLAYDPDEDELNDE